ncbi:hypothetical protein CL176_01710 [Suicoccus acidiformans]|uniref:Uncharacterized protein n=1 Tax=Suicoccus acidiformans TaxID=2036206 RepID=A0A347WIC8_9LACT|nr:hypothetical protein [Suicoccus acidiformans]AXY24835.1 hypothetical protein CL176_01710 [Suicoccus acidiformans]
MSLVTIIQELWRFVKDNRFRILLGTLLGAVLVVGLRYAITNYVLRDSREAFNELREVYSQEPAEFQILVTIEDGQLFSNAFAYEEYMASEPVVRQIEAETGIEFYDWYKNEQTLELYKTTNYRGGLAGIRNSDSGVFTFRFAVADSPEANLAIAQAYADLILRGDAQFMEGHTVQMVTEPAIQELLPEELLPNVGTPESLSTFGVMNPLKTMLYTIIGAIIGLILSLTVLFLRSVFGAKITYAFDYTWDVEDQHLLFEAGKAGRQTDLADLLLIPRVPERLVVSQQTAHLSECEADGLLFLNHVQALPETAAPTDIVLIIYSHQTDKQWYQEQFNLLKLYRLPVKIIHVY